MWKLICDFSHVIFACEILHLKFYNWEATRITAQKRSHRWNFTREMSIHKKFNFWKFTWGISHVNFPMRWLTNKIAHLNHIRLLTCEISHVTIHIWNFTCEISYVKFHMWNFTCEKSHVKFHMWNTCEKSHVKFHMWNTSTLHMCFTCEKSHGFLKLHMWFTCAISVRDYSIQLNLS